MSKFEGKVVVVTGAGSGVGRAVARRFAEDGARLALIARGGEALDGVRAEVEAVGGEALAMPADVSDAAALDAAADRIESGLGAIDVWVNDAMTTVFSFFEEIEPEEFERATDVTYHGTVWGTRAALKRMLPRDSGVVVQVGSAMAYQGIPLQAPYSGAKHAMKGFVDSIRTELRHRGSRVHVTMVQLPGLNTPQFDHCRSKMPRHPMPVPPVYQPEVAADAVHWAAGHRRRQVYVGIPTVYTVLGSKFAPWLAERYLAKTAVEGQQAEGPPTPTNGQGNLMQPPPEDPGSHGAFDEMAHGRSLQWWLSRHRWSIAGLLAGGAAGAALRLASNGGSGSSGRRAGWSLARPGS